MRRLPDPISVSRQVAAQMLGVSVDTIDEAKVSGKLHPKALSIRKDGSVSKELYDVRELRAFFDGLEDA